MREFKFLCCYSSVPTFLSDDNLNERSKVLFLTFQPFSNIVFSSIYSIFIPLHLTCNCKVLAFPKKMLFIDERKLYLHLKRFGFDMQHCLKVIQWLN